MQRVPFAAAASVAAATSHAAGPGDGPRVLETCHKSGRGHARHNVPLIGGCATSEPGIADLIVFLESRTDRDVPADPGLNDPWPAGHPARGDKPMPLP
ncbi:MAG: hypothetical protein MUF73_17555 [Rhodobacteraceae bacterium]|jgi:hypothetical protein|nr:hypothetical protein [Paracoccaceae bacterium]